MGDILQNISVQWEKLQEIYIYTYIQNYQEEILGYGWLILVYKWDVTCTINQFILKGNWGVYRCHSIRRKVNDRKDLFICFKVGQGS
jgi:hypothetical protein